MNDLKKYINIIKEASDWEANNSLESEPRRDRREGNRQTLRQQIFDYLDDAQAAVDAGQGEQAKEYIGYVIELVDDNL